MAAGNEAKLLSYGLFSTNECAPRTRVHLNQDICRV